MKPFSAFLALPALVLLCGCLSRLAPPSAQTSIASLDAIDPYGSVNLDTPSADLLAQGFQWGDEVRVQVNGQDHALPLLPHYRLVAAGDAALVAWNEGSRPARLAVFYGSFAERFGIADKASTPSGPAWKPRPGVQFPLDVSITRGRPGLYAANLDLMKLRRTNLRADYPSLSDDDFANFRAVSAPRLRPGTLFRSSSPIQTELERNGYVDAACRRMGVRCIVDMADSKDAAHAARGFAGSYVSTLPTLYRPMGVDVSSPDFGRDLAECIRFLTSHESPCLLHCKEGQDRTGFACAVLECFFGASPDEVEDDYLRTFRNFYGVQPGAPAETALRATLARILERAFPPSADLSSSDLSAPARAYLLSIGLSEDDLALLEDRFGLPTP